MSVSRADWLTPLGSPGRIEVTELLHPESWGRYFAADREAQLELATVALDGDVLEVVATWMRRTLRLGEEVIVDLDLSGEPQPTLGFRKQLSLRGVVGSVEVHTDDTRRSRVRGALRYLRVAVGERAWAWHFEGGRVAGERLVLCRGDRPGEGPALVTTHPAARGRYLGSTGGGATADTHVTTWGADASRVEVALAELLAVGRMDGLVDYRPARIAEGFSELLEVAPRADPNVE